MSGLNPELNLYERINVCRTHPKFSPLCFDKLWDRKSTATISLEELRQLYQQSRTEEERDRCFDPKILNRLRMKNFNEIVLMNMDPENNQFFANHKILHSFKGRIVLEGENKKFSENFYQHFLSLIDKIEGNLLLTFADLRAFKNNYAEQCAQILSKKLERGEKVFCVDFSLQPQHTHGFEIKQCMNNDFTIYYRSYLFEGNRNNFLTLQKKNSVANTETLIGMINKDRFIGEKQHLVRVLPLLKAAALPGGGRNIECDNCGARQDSFDNGFGILLWMKEPALSNCDGCLLK